MDVTSIVGKTIRAIWVFRSEGVHPAWIDSNTLPIIAFGAFLEFVDGGFVRISPCELSPSSDRYPSLSLELRPCAQEEMHYVSPEGHRLEAERLAEAHSLLPFVVTGAEMSDPLGEDAITQYSLSADDGRVVSFRHVMPPMTLGISVATSTN